MYKSVIPEALLRSPNKLEQEIAEAKASSVIVVFDQSSQGRLSRMDTTQQQKIAFSHLNRLLTKQHKLEAATARFRSDSYGIFCRYGGEVGPQGIKADPAAQFCSVCESQD